VMIQQPIDGKAFQWRRSILFQAVGLLLPVVEKWPMNGKPDRVSYSKSRLKRANRADLGGHTGVEFPAHLRALMIRRQEFRRPLARQRRIGTDGPHK